MKIIRNITNNAFFRFIKNTWKFRKELSDFYSWDYTYNLNLFKKSIELTKDCIDKYGHEVDESRLPKIEKMKRVIELINNFNESNFIEQAQIILGLETVSNYSFESIEDKPEYYHMIDHATAEEQENNKKIFNLSMKLEEEQWNELWNIIKGGDLTDGSDMRTWWD
jgi:hypothetical protein